MSILEEAPQHRIEQRSSTIRVVDVHFARKPARTVRVGLRREQSAYAIDALACMIGAKSLTVS
jgi:hypothetical protein